MLIHLIQVLITLTNPHHSQDWRHERAHVACETAVYAIVAPEITDDDATTPIGEAICESLCRGDDESPGDVLSAEEVCRAIARKGESWEDACERATKVRQ